MVAPLFYSLQQLIQVESNSMIKHQIEQRLKDLDWTLYRLAKEVSALRATRSGTKPYPAVRYHTAIGKALDNISQSKLETITEIVEALGGTVQISWNVQPDAKAAGKPTAVTTYAHQVE